MGLVFVAAYALIQWPRDDSRATATLQAAYFARDAGNALLAAYSAAFEKDGAAGVQAVTANAVVHGTVAKELEEPSREPRDRSSSPRQRHGPP